MLEDHIIAGHRIGEVAFFFFLSLKVQHDLASAGSISSHPQMTLT